MSSTKGKKKAQELQVHYYDGTMPIRQWWALQEREALFASVYRRGGPALAVEYFPHLTKPAAQTRAYRNGIQCPSRKASRKALAAELGDGDAQTLKRQYRENRRQMIEESARINEEFLYIHRGHKPVGEWKADTPPVPCSIFNLAGENHVFARTDTVPA